MLNMPELLLKWRGFSLVKVHEFSTGRCGIHTNNGDFTGVNQIMTAMAQHS
jgi:hypothetical protein